LLKKRKNLDDLMDVEVIQKLPNYILKDKFLVLSEKDTLLF
jgi:hypothetical protein